MLRTLGISFGDVIYTFRKASTCSVGLVDQLKFLVGQRLSG